MTPSRVTIGWWMVVIAGLAVVLAIGVSAPALLLPIGWLGSGGVGFLLGRRWPELSLPVAILVDLAALGVGLGFTLYWLVGPRRDSVLLLILGGLLVLGYPIALGCILGRVGRPMPEAPDKLADRWLLLMALLPLVPVVGFGWYIHNEMALMD